MTDNAWTPPNSDDPRLPGMDEAIKFVSGFLTYYQGARSELPAGREIFHLLKELEAHRQDIEDGEE
ncbi:hypothetical protein ABQE69_09105 [Mycolicibacillus trivialis]